MKPPLVVHADWSSNADKRWMATRKLERAGILTLIDGASQITYACTPILDIIYLD